MCCLATVVFAAAPDFSGSWVGELKNYPPRPGAPSVTVKREIGPFPEADNTCSTFKTTYFENGVQRGVKDYKLCRGKGPNDLYFDEGGGVRLDAQWLGDVLVAPFKYDKLLLISLLRLRGDVLEEEIYTVPDSDSNKGILPLAAKSLQRLELRRAATKQ
ncbi:hypothetical protein F183_A29530 [Bryobacterales bacterium F-183]|nr:hypothetical protein F183_A29530 [Bryobacterales bacterium F-183]